MNHATIDPDVRASFRTAAGGFISRNAGALVSCPPYVIASVASRLPAGMLEMPPGYDLSVLESIMSLTGCVDRDVTVTSRQAAELAQIATQILAFNTAQKIDPPLSYYHEQSAAHLVALASDGRQ